MNELIEQLQDLVDRNAPWDDDVLIAAIKLIRDIDALHARHPKIDRCQTCHLGHDWPCPTHRLIHGDRDELLAEAFGEDES